MLVEHDWNGELFLGSPPPGYRIRILGPDASTPADHVSGGRPSDIPGDVLCPNCSGLMFVPYSVDMTVPGLRTLGLWSRPRLSVLVCPRCALYMEPYWVVFGETPTIVGGERDGGKVLQEVETPYEQRAAELSALAPDDYPTSHARIDALRARVRDPGVYHQIGGVPVFGGYDQLSCCRCNLPMAFTGVIDNDDLNVPLYEPGHEPVSLIIGDMDCLNVFACAACTVLGMKWVH